MTNLPNCTMILFVRGYLHLTLGDPSTNYKAEVLDLVLPLTFPVDYQLIQHQNFCTHKAEWKILWLQDTFGWYYNKWFLIFVESDVQFLYQGKSLSGWYTKFCKKFNSITIVILELKYEITDSIPDSTFLWELSLIYTDFF